MSKAYKPAGKDVRQFTSVTGAKRDVAVSMLEACAGNLELAISMHLDGSSSAPAADALAGSAQAATASSSGMSNGAAISSSGHGAIPMDEDDDSVRAPIPSRQEVLVGGPSLLPARRSRRGAPSNPFNHMRDFQAEGLLTAGGSDPKAESSRNLARLFQPPLDIMCRGSLADVRSAAASAGKWLLVDVHDRTAFDCQKLNRDLWRNNDVRRLIEDNFAFWQVQDDSVDGRRYQQFYPCDSFPHIAFLDPRTGERLQHFGFIEAKEFCARTQEFLSRHALPVHGLEADVERKAVSRSSTNCKAEAQSRRHRPARLGDDEEAAAIANAIAVSRPDQYQGCITRLSSSSESEMSDGDEEMNPPPLNAYARKPLLRNRAQIIRDDDEEEAEEEEEEEEEEDADRGNVVITRARRGQQKRKLSDFDPANVECAGLDGPVASWGRAKRLKRTVTDGSVQSATQALAAASMSRTSGRTKAAHVTQNGYGGIPVAAATAAAAAVASPEPSPSPSPVSTAAPDWSCSAGQPTSRLLFRLPDGTRNVCQAPVSATVQSLFQYAAYLGYGQPEFSIVFPYPRRQLADFPMDNTLDLVGLCPSGTLCIEEAD